MRVIRSLAFYCVFYGASVFYVALAVAALTFAPRWLAPLADSWSACHRACLRVLAGIRLEVSGMPAAGPALYAIKHESFFEAIDLPTLLHRPVGFAKEELFRIPGWGLAAARYGMVPVARGEGARAVRDMLAAARRVAGSGRPLAIFPEGTRVPHGERPPLKSGFAALYKVLDMPVVPVAVDSGRAYTPRWKRPGTIRLHFGEPIPPGLPRAEIEARVHAAINLFNQPEAG